MKTAKQVNELLSSFGEKYSYPIKDAQQGSEAWFNLKLGVVSASNAKKAVAKVGSDTRDTYMACLIGQVCTGQMEEINSRHLEWGTANEDSARASYEFLTNQKMTELPFVFKDDTFRCGASPDGYVDDNKGGEIKCPSNTENHVKHLLNDKLKADWDWQIQYSMWVTGATTWDFCSYDPRMLVQPLIVKTIEKDEKKHKQLDEMIPKFIEDMDKVMASMGIKFGDQWERLKLTQEKAG